MKKLSKILALTLSLFLLLPIAIGAAGNPDRIPGSLQYFDTSFYVGSSGHNYFAILPGHTGTNGGGFGSSNPIGMGKIDWEEVAKALGISVSALSMYEQGNRIPRDEIKIRMAEYYGISIEALFLILMPTKREEEVNV